MIPGRRLEALSAKLLWRDTYGLMLAPAIADLQFEYSRGGSGSIVRSYAGVWRALAGALCHDLVCAAAMWVADDDRGAALRAELATCAWLTVFQIGYFAGALTLAFRSWADLRDALPLLSLVLLAPVLPVLACFWPDRDADSSR